MNDHAAPPTNPAPTDALPQQERSVSDLARRVLFSIDIEEKLRPADNLDALIDDRGTVDPLPEEPTRPDDLIPVPRGVAVKVPPAEGMRDRSQRARLLHALANHELQAAELFAWALLAFPDAPDEYRRGLLNILDDEQRHTRMYLARLEAMNGRFGSQPVTGYFWNKLSALNSPVRFVCAMSLTFENANLDHTTDYATIARSIGDEKTAHVIERVHLDEIEHVRFGWRWLGEFKKPEQSMWEAYCANLGYPLQPNRAVGRTFHPSGREAVGMEADFIEALRVVTTTGRYPRWD